MPIGNRPVPEDRYAYDATQQPHPLGSSFAQVPWAQHHPAATLAYQMAVLLHTLGTVRGAVQELSGTAWAAAPIFNFRRSPSRTTTEYFTAVHGGSFVRRLPSGQCTRVFLSGVNKYELVEAGAGAPALFDGQLADRRKTGPAVVRDVLAAAAASGATLLRFNAFAVDARYSALRQAARGGPLTFAEGVLRGLDYVLDEARKAGVRVLLVLTDYFSNGAGGPLQYMGFTATDTTGLAPTAIKSLFFVDASARRAADYFRQYITAVVNRVNTINGRRYGDDPTVFGWDLMNEPRCEDAGICGSGSTAVAAWAADLVAHIKRREVRLDAKHPVTLGLDGFWSEGPNVDAKPFSSASSYGVDFVATSASVDFLSMNIYPDGWNNLTTSWLSECSVAPPPPQEVCMQPWSGRDEWYGRMLDAIATAAEDDRDAVGGIKGGAYFQSFVNGTRASWLTQSAGGRWGIFPGSSTAALLQNFSSKVAALNGGAAFACPEGVPALDSALFEQRVCPSGWEGPSCDVDINECSRGTHQCSPNAACVNTAGGYSCQCWTGWSNSGSPAGRTCNQNTLTLLSIDSSFYTNNKVREEELPHFFTLHQPSPHFPSPAHPPPAGYFDGRPDQSRLNVTLLECKVACRTAAPAGCTGLFYDSLQQRCFLKKARRDLCPTDSACPGPTTFTCEDERWAPNSYAPPQQGYRWLCSSGVTYYQRNLGTGSCPSA
eukprot:scaffold4.g4834.t1